MNLKQDRQISKKIKIFKKKVYNSAYTKYRSALKF